MTKSNKRYAGLMKFGKKEHMEDFYNKGYLYINTFDFFRELEDCGDGRADRNEYATDHYAGEHLNELRIEITGPDNKIHMLSPEGGLLSVTTRFPQKDEFTHLFCMSTIDVDWVKENNKLICEKNFADGKDYVVMIYDHAAFIDRVIKSLRNKCEKVKYGSIEYINENEYGGEIGCFRKFSEYSYQNEFRFAFRSIENGPIKVDIGSLADIAHPPVSKEEFYKLPYTFKNEED